MGNDQIPNPRLRFFCSEFALHPLPTGLNNLAIYTKQKIGIGMHCTYENSACGSEPWPFPFYGTGIFLLRSNSGSCYIAQHIALESRSSNRTLLLTYDRTSGILAGRKRREHPVCSLLFRTLLHRIASPLILEASRQTLESRIRWIDEFSSGGQSS